MHKRHASSMLRLGPSKTPGSRLLGEQWLLLYTRVVTVLSHYLRVEGFLSLLPASILKALCEDVLAFA